ncbi:MAG: GTP-binding protein [Myxococcales bacterium]|nr:GTP-binding protein [Myxococcales bacterium]
MVTGFLGVGKTTAILDLFGHRPPDGRWAVLVNEFGEVGIDGAVYEHGGLTVAEVPGGCICCSAGLALRQSLVTLLRDVKPDRLLIEPTGLAHPASVIDTLRTPGLKEAVDVRAVVGLVDPRHVRSPRHLDSDPWRDQIRIADVLVANKTDVCSEADLLAFRALAAEAWPEKLVVAETQQGRMDPAWLELGSVDRPADAPLPHSTDGVDHHGYLWPPEAAFDREALQELLQRTVRPEDGRGVLRMKGIFRVRRGWYLVQADPDAIRWSPVGHRRDSRLEVIAQRGDVSFDALGQALDAIRLR